MKDLKKVLKKFFNRYWPFLAMLLLVAIFFWKFFLLGQIPIPGDFVIGTYYPWLDYKWGYSVGVPVKNPILTDVVSFSYPIRLAAVNILKQGKAPLWNRYILTGIPLMANFQSAPFSPTNIFYFIFDNLPAWSIQVAAQHFFAYLFMYIFLRYMKLSNKSSLLGGFIYTFSGFNLIWSQWNAHTLAASFIPLGLFLLGNWIDLSKNIYLYIFSMCLFLQIASGYPQIVFYTLPLSFLFVLFKIKSKLHIRKWVGFTCAVLLGFGLASLILLPSQELLGLSQREVEPLDYSSAFLPWQEVITFIAPDYFGNHATGNYWGPTDYTTTTGFVGVIALTLAIIPFILMKRNKEVVFFGFILILSFILSFPTPVSVFIWKVGLLGMQAASAHRAMILFTLSISVLSGFGVEMLLKKDVKNIIAPLLLPAIILTPFIFFSVVSYFGNGSFLGLYSIEKWKILVSLRNLFLPIVVFFSLTCLLIIYRLTKIKNDLVFLMIFLLAVFELFRFGWKFTPFTDPDLVYPNTPVTEFLINQTGQYRVSSEGVIPINIKMAYQIESIEGYDAIYPLSIAQLVASANSENENASPQGRYASVTNLSSPFINYSNTKYILDLKRNERGEPDTEGVSLLEVKYPNLKKVFEDKTTVVLENTESLPRAYLFGNYMVEKDMKTTLKNVVSPDFDYKKIVYLDSEPGIPQNTDVYGNATYIEYSDNKQVLKVVSNSDAVLFVSDLNYPGWKAYVNNIPSKIFNANYCFRAVPVRSGDNIVEFIYESETYGNGIVISLISFVVWFILLIYESKIRKISS